MKELVLLVATTALCGSSWAGKCVQFRLDNQAVVQVLTLGSARDSLLSNLLRCLFFLETYFKCQHIVAHVAGWDNTVADAISRNNPF